MKEKIKALFGNTNSKLKKFPEHKQYIEFITAVLSIPVLLTVILLNVNNLNSQKSKTDKSPTANDTKTVKEIIYVSPSNTSTSRIFPTSTSVPTANYQICKKEIGPISITSPNEGDIITDNPVSIDIEYQQGNYCSVVWSYRVNGGRWSEYNDQSVSLYNLPQGNITFELRVKSLVTGDEKNLQRSFTYGNTALVTPNSQNTNSSSSSAH